jgi:hypothetical protein
VTFSEISKSSTDVPNPQHNDRYGVGRECTEDSLIMLIA